MQERSLLSQKSYMFDEHYCMFEQHGQAMNNCLMKQPLKRFFLTFLAGNRQHLHLKQTASVENRTKGLAVLLQLSFYVKKNMNYLFYE